MIRRPALPFRSRATWLRDSLPASGQALVEFTLVFPILLIFLLTVADFGRYFATAIQVESAARTAAEVAAREYLREPQPIDLVSGYGRIDSHAWQSICDELGGLPNASPAPDPDEQCGGLPTLVCAHDGSDPGCDAIYNGGGSVPAQCGSLQAGAAPSNAQTGGAESSRYVEVRVCYRFSTLLPLRIPYFDINLLPITGDFYIERARVFTVADY